MIRPSGGRGEGGSYSFVRSIPQCFLEYKSHKLDEPKGSYVNFTDYRSEYFPLYSEFASVVSGILEEAMKANNARAQVWEFQSRAKSHRSLERKLVERGLLASDTIEQEIKDLSGTRIIFYSNDDVDWFLRSSIISDNFEVDWDQSKIHYSIGEAADVRDLYRAHHYMVSLNEIRLKLPEYGRFSGLRCEVQIQTILNHAWSETGHEAYHHACN